MSDLVLDASLGPVVFGRGVRSAVWPQCPRKPLSSKRAVVPILWFYEVGNGLLMDYRGKRITCDQIDGFLTRLKASPLSH